MPSLRVTAAVVAALAIAITAGSTGGAVVNRGGRSSDDPVRQSAAPTAASAEGAEGGPAPTSAPSGSLSAAPGDGHQDSTDPAPPPATADALTDAGLAAPGEGHFERVWKPTGTRVLTGTSGDTEWRLYASHDERARTCIRIYSLGPGGGGSAATCEQRLPLDVSSHEGGGHRILTGLVTPAATNVRVEHVDGTTVTTEAVGAPGFHERFYGLAVSFVPVRRLVALDSAHNVVAERRDLGWLDAPAP